MNDNSMKLNLIQKAGYNTKAELDAFIKKHGLTPPQNGGVQARLKLIMNSFSYKKLVEILYNK